MSRFKKHVAKWQYCTKCRLHECRKQTVFTRGVLPCEALFIGEAPGISEDSLGVPFIGPAGKLLDSQIKEAEEDAHIDVRKAFTNIVCCIPKVPNTNRKAEEPLPEEIEACYPRLVEFFGIAKPDLVVCVGQHADKLAKIKGWSSRFKKVISITHPAAILRAPAMHQTLANQRVVVTLTNAFIDLIPF